MKTETEILAPERPAGPGVSHLLSSRSWWPWGRARLALVIHLLVNVWLLCLLSALLLVLGRWLGSDAIVGLQGGCTWSASSQWPSAPKSRGREAAEQEIDRTIRMIMDFVSRPGTTR